MYYISTAVYEITICVCNSKLLVTTCVLILEKIKPVLEKTKPPAEKVQKPIEIDKDEDLYPANFQNQDIDDGDSYFFSYFMMVCVTFIGCYVAYHNKQKVST